MSALLTVPSATAFPSQSAVLEMEYGEASESSCGHEISSEKSTNKTFPNTSREDGYGLVTSAIMYKVSSVTDPRTSVVANESYPEQKSFALISHGPSFKPFRKYWFSKSHSKLHPSPRACEHCKSAESVAPASQALIHSPVPGLRNCKRMN